jgi:hypothetical protein
MKGTMVLLLESKNGRLKKQEGRPKEAKTSFPWLHILSASVAGLAVGWGITRFFNGY